MPDDISVFDSTELFRLVALRAPALPTGKVPRIDIQFEESETPQAHTHNHTSAPAVIWSFEDEALDNTLHLEAFNTFLLNHDDAVEPKDILDWFQKALGRDLERLASSRYFQDVLTAMHRALLMVLGMANTSHGLDDVQVSAARESLVRGIRLLGLMELVVQPGALADAESVQLYLRHSIIALPKQFRAPAERLARPPAIADLKVVRLGSPRYEPGAIAHIENVMGHETRERTHRFLEQMETTQTSFSERMSETEQELGTQSQVEMQQEAAKILEESLDLEIGAAVSASYGPTVSVELDARVARNTSKMESNRSAASFSSQIVKRARERLIQRTSETRVARRLLETEETNVHGFTNPDPTHITGVYRWVDSVQDAWIENYGKRLMLDFLIPEPAAMVRWASERSATKVDIGPAPESPRNPSNSAETLMPQHINENNYLGLVGLHGATNVPTPPASTIDLAVGFKGQSTDPPLVLQLAEDSTKMVVPKGYQAESWEAHCLCWGYKYQHGESWKLSVGVAGQIHELAGIQHLIMADKLNAEEGSPIPVIVLSHGNINFSTSVRVRCVRTDRGLARWQMDVYAATQSAYQQKLEDWQLEKARAEALGMGSEESPLNSLSNPTENRATERRELRRSVIHMLLSYPPNEGIFINDAVDDTDKSVAPVLNLEIAAQERDTIAFLEQSFDWPNMTWVHYPYYWARKDKWIDDCKRTGSDPIWAAFLSAGASRCVVPVRPGFEAAVSFFLATGVIWSGGQVPTIGDPAYLGIAEEMAEAIGTGQVPLERIDLDPVRLPTSLIWLQPTPDLNPEP